MKTIVKIIACVSVTAALAACQQFEIDTQYSREKAEANVRLKSDALDAYSFAANSPQPVSFNVSANVPWTISRSETASWCTVSPSSSSAKGLIADVTISTVANTTDQDRSVTLTLKAEGSYKTNTYTIVVTQDRQGKLYVTPIAKDYVATGGPLMFTVQSNRDWEVRCDQNWITFDKTSGKGSDEMVKIEATAAASDRMERTATIYVTAGDDEKSFQVVQKGRFDVKAPSEPIADLGGSASIGLRTDLPWEIASDKDWLSLDAAEGTGDGTWKTITATAVANTGATRKATVSIKAGDTTKTLQVTQKGIAFEVEEPASTVLATEGEEIVLNVNTSMAWEPVSDAAWAVAEKVDDAHLKVSFAYNDKFLARTATVGIKSGDNEATVSFSQDINFTFAGHYELLDDGSLKVYQDQKSGIYTKKNYRYVIMDAEVEMHLGDAGRFLIGTEHYSDGYEYELQFNLTRTDAFRLRYAGEKVGGSNSKQITGFDKAKANAMTHAKIQFVPNAGDPTKIDLTFFCDGVQQEPTLTGKSVFKEDATLGGNYCVVNHEIASDGSYFIIKSCIVTPIAE